VPVSTPVPSSASRPARRRLRRTFTALVVGMALLGALGTAVALDVRDFDRTSGGYSAPYEGWTGEPIDWSAAERTDDGFSRPGRVVGSELDCTTGMISFRVAGVSIDFRTVSARAIAVHRPREACAAAGFDPEF
jgi:hypothetical protein